VIQVGAAPLPVEHVRSSIDEILSRSEFSGRRGAFGQWLDDTLDKILSAIGDLFGIAPGAAGGAIVVIAYVALGAALAWIVWRIVRARIATQNSAPDAPAPNSIEARRARVADLRRAAGAARATGNHVLALRLYFTALVVGLGERGDLEYRDAWTNRELLERGEPSEKIERTLSPLVRDLDAKSFGGVVAIDADVAQMSRVVDDLLGAERA